MTALSHVPVLAAQALAALAVRADGVYVDATFGRGGHSRLILRALGPAGRLVAMDRDPAAIAAGGAIADPRFTLVHARFARLSEVLDTLRLDKVDGVLLDLGVSSPQLDEAARGFSLRLDGPLDMRMNPGEGMSAREWLARAGEQEIAEVIRDYGEERFAKPIARALVAARAAAPIGTTARFAQIVAGAVRTREPGQHPATRSFQAVRIYLNRELEELMSVLPQAVDRLGPGGRLAVISFHSLEDRIVKRFLRAEAAGERLPDKLPLREAERTPGRLCLIGRAQRASAEEAAANSRARSAVLRVAERRA